MRILVVTNLFPPAVEGGYELECAGAVEGLRAHGHDVRVLTSRRGRTSSPEDGIARELPFLDDTKRAHVAAAYHAVAGMRVATAELSGFRPDLIYVWNGARVPHSSIHALLSSGLPTAFRVCQHWFGSLFAGDLFMRYLRPGARGTRRIWSAFSRAANVASGLRLSTEPRAPVAVSWVSDYLRRAVAVPVGLEPVVETTIHATPPDAEALASLERRPASAPLVAFVGRLSWEKGADVAIRAIGELALRGLDVHLILAGPGARRDRKRLEALAQEVGVRGRCSFAGTLQRDELHALLARASAIAIPSVWDEPLGLVVSEAALARVPIVASAVGGIPELVSPQEALLVPRGDPGALANGLADVLEHPEAAAARVRRAFARARKLSWERYVAATLAFVHEAYETLRDGSGDAAASSPPRRAQAGR